MKKKMNHGAFIFDMDGVLTDNAEFHYGAWEAYCKGKGLSYRRQDARYWFGQNNHEILERIYGRPFTEEETVKEGEIKERIYREMISGRITAVPGLRSLLKDMQEAGYPVALATSAPPENVDFVLSELSVKSFFDKIVDATGVQHGKPAPDIYLRAASLVGVSPARCVVFEDARAGIAAARAAGMKVVGLVTTLTREELEGTVLNINDFSEITLQSLEAIVSEDS